MKLKLLKISGLRKLPITCFRTVSFILFIITALINFNGCGVYSFTGASVPAHIKTIFIPIADNRSGSAEPNLNESFTQTLIQKFIDDNTLQVSNRNNANSILECTITEFSDVPAVVSAESTGESVTVKRITVSVQVTYRDLVKKKKIFEKTFSDHGDYDPANIDKRTGAITTAIDHITDDILLAAVSGW